MTVWSTIVLSLLPALSAAQAPSLAQPAVLDELRAVRATLERLEKSQQMLVALTRIQIGESRLAIMEVRRQQLLAEERGLTLQVAQYARLADPASTGSVMRLTQIDPSTGAAVTEPSATRAGDTASIGALEADARTRLQQVQAELRTTEQSIAAVKTEIAAWEKYFAEAVR